MRIIKNENHRKSVKGVDLYQMVTIRMTTILDNMSISVSPKITLLKQLLSISDFNFIALLL